MSNYKQTSESKKILLCLSGSIACFKAAALLSQLVQKKYDVRVAVTKGALEFIGLSTLEGLSGHPVFHNLFEAGQAMDHIYSQRWCDLLLYYPTTANLVNKMSSGLADDVPSSLFLSHDFKKPIWIAPAMNQSMFQHPTTQASLQKLKGWGVEILSGEAGVQACGEYGPGRLMEPEILLQRIQELFSMRSSEVEL